MTSRTIDAGEGMNYLIALNGKPESGFYVNY